MHAWWNLLMEHPNRNTLLCLPMFSFIYLTLGNNSLGKKNLSNQPNQQKPCKFNQSNLLLSWGNLVFWNETCSVVAAVLSLSSNYQSVSGFPQVAFVFPAGAGRRSKVLAAHPSLVLLCLSAVISGLAFFSPKGRTCRRVRHSKSQTSQRMCFMLFWLM